MSEKDFFRRHHQGTEERLYDHRTKSTVVSTKQQGERGTNNNTVKATSGSQTKPFKRLADKEFSEKKARNECFKCDEKYFKGHQCKNQFHQIELVIEDEHCDG